jgi:hypothetical protein
MQENSCEPMLLFGLIGSTFYGVVAIVDFGSTLCSGLMTMACKCGADVSLIEAPACDPTIAL